MNGILKVESNDDMPCNSWVGTSVEISDEECPMKDKWRNGEVIMCSVCGHLIGYNTDKF
jgi:hypothetical protein